MGSGSIITTGSGNTITISGSLGSLQFTGNTGTAAPVANNINTIGSGSITTTASGDTVTTALFGLTEHSLLLGGASPDTIVNLGVATNGQLPIGSTGADPVLATLSIANGINVVNGAGSITISNLRDVGRYVVAPVAGQAGYTSIQTAINQAVTDGASATTPATVWIMSGTYTEDLTLAPFVHLSSKATNTVNIIGNTTFTPLNDGDSISFHFVDFTSPGGGGSAFSILGTNICSVTIDTCLFTGSTGNSFSVNNPDCNFYIHDSVLTAAAGFKIFDITACNDVFIYDTVTTSTDTESTIAGDGNVKFFGCFVTDSFIQTDNNTLVLKSCVAGSLGTLSICDVGPTNLFVFFDSVALSNATSGYWVTGTGLLLYGASIALVVFSAQQIDPALTVIDQPLGVRNLSFDGGLTSIVNDGELIIGSSTGHPEIATLTAGAGISITNAPGSITIAATGGGFTWTDQSGAFNAVASNGYFITATANSTLPATPSQGDTVKFIVDTTDTLQITANTGQVIRLGISFSVAAGTCLSNAHGDSIELVYRTADTTWLATYAIGTWTIT